jgi:hypothetical protein
MKIRKTTLLALALLAFASAGGSAFAGVSVPPVRPAVTLVVAASNSVNTAGADYICPGTADQTTINSAINALPSARRPHCAQSRAILTVSAGCDR